MTPLGLVPMRLAATAAHALPGLRLRLRDGSRTLLDVTWSTDVGAASVTPCVFRRAVARAHRQLEDGSRLRFLDLPEGGAPAIDVAVRPTDRIHPSGIYRLATGAGQMHAFVTTLAPAQCRRVLDAQDHEPGIELRLHRDVATDVTVVQSVDEDMSRASTSLSILEDVLAGCFAEEVAQTLVAS